jgi:uncharacterized ParB-like nuclease family protein
MTDEKKRKMEENCEYVTFVIRAYFVFTVCFRIESKKQKKKTTISKRVRAQKSFETLRL